MTDIALTPGAELAPAPADEPVQPADEPAQPEYRRRRRRRIALLIFLSLLATGLLAFSGWYLLFRKPISQIPIPGFDLLPMPNYSYSLYGPQRPTGIAVTPDGGRIYVTQTSGDAAIFELDPQGQVLNTIVPGDTSTDHVFVSVALNPLTGDL